MTNFNANDLTWLLIRGDHQSALGPGPSSWLLREAHDLVRYSSLLAAATASSYAIAGSIWIGTRIDPTVLVLIFLGTFSLYTCDRLGDYTDTADLKNMPARSQWIAQHATALQASVVGSLLGSVFLLFYRPAAAIMYIVLFIIASTYSLKILPGGRAMRQLPGTKAFFVGTCFGITCAGLPYVTSPDGDPVNAIIVGLSLTCLVTSQVNLSDVSDIEGDKEAGTLSAAVLLGESRARALTFFLIGLGGALSLILGSTSMLCTSAVLLFASCFAYDKRIIMVLPDVSGVLCAAAAVVFL